MFDRMLLQLHSTEYACLYQDKQKSGSLSGLSAPPGEEMVNLVVKGKNHAKPKYTNPRRLREDIR